MNNFDWFRLGIEIANEIVRKHNGILKSKDVTELFLETKKYLENLCPVCFLRHIHCKNDLCNHCIKEQGSTHTEVIQKLKSKGYL